MKGLKVDKRSLCDTSKALRVATKLSALKKECNIDSVKLVLKSIDELDSYFLGDDDSKFSLKYAFFPKNNFCIIYSLGDIERCIYINKNGYVIFSADRRYNFYANADLGIIKLVSNAFLRATKEWLTVKVSDYLDIIVK